MPDPVFRRARRSRAVAGGALACALLALSQPALAKKICVEDSDGYAWVFPRAMLPKKVGKVAELAGYTRSPIGQIGTVSGTAVRIEGGAFAMGVKSLRWGIDSVLGITSLGTVDADLAGSLVVENTFPPQTIPLVSVDCDTIPAP
jgi:hypothetical protein